LIRSSATWAPEYDAKYATRELLWSEGPNRFLPLLVEGLPPGRALDLACGEGRNALWLAAQGWQATGVDFSPVALERGRRIAA
jgi:SAM-dependent methyltransferase